MRKCTAILGTYKSTRPRLGLGFVFTRLYSTQNELLEQIKNRIQSISDDQNGKFVTSLMSTLNGKDDQYRSLVKQINELDSIPEDTRHSILNEVLSLALKHDFSLYYNVPENHQWSAKAIKTLVQANPGRAMSTWELIARHSIDPADDLLEVLVEKALFGERYEQEESEQFEFSGMHIYKAIDLFGRISQPSKEILKLLVSTLIEQNALSSLKYAKIDPTILKEILEEDISPVAYLRIFQVLFELEPGMLSKKDLSKALLNCYASNKLSFETALDHDTKSCKQLEKFFGEPMAPIDTKLLMVTIVAYIDQIKLDSDRTPDSLLLRLEMVRAYGIYLDDISAALEKFHYYQTHDKFGIEFVQLNLQQAFTYQAVLQDNPHYLKVAETLITPEQIAVTSLKHLILARSAFDVNSSLELYNDYIQKVSKDINSTTNRSAAGQLTEALMLANLYNNDREFAHVIFDGAVALGTVKDEHEITKLQNLFKVYGDAWKHDNWESAKPILKSEILKHIQQ